MKVIQGDITKIEGTFAIAHILSNAGVYNAGVAKAIASKWGSAKSYYMARAKLLELGETQVIPVELPSTHGRYGYVVNMIAQDGYGRDGRDYIDYHNLDNTLFQLYRWHRNSVNETVPLYMPYGMGAGLAGGNWKEIEERINNYVPYTTLVKLSL